MKPGPRILESEAMMSVQEVLAYDRLTLRYLKILHAGFAETVLNFSPVSGRFLEVGTGTGRIAIEVAKYAVNAEIFALDLSENMLAVAKNNASRQGVGERITFLLADAKELSFDDHHFDSVFCHNMLHHIADPLLVLKEMNRVVKRDGAVIVRDLVRCLPFWVPFHVNILGLPYNALMKKEYRDSIHAALSREEWVALCNNSGILGAYITKQFITHQGIERPSQDRRKQCIHLPVPLLIRPLKKMYVSRPRNH